MGYIFLIHVLCALLGSVSASSWELSGSNVTVLTGGAAVLQCDITSPADAGNQTVLQVWKYSSDELIFFTDTPVQADKDRMSVNLNEDSMSLVISDVTLTDEKVYKCGLNGIDPPVYHEVQLTVNQYPQEFYVTDYDTEADEGTEATLAECVAKGAKPKPVMWFTDSNGNTVDISEDVEGIARENGVVDGSLYLKSTFTKNNHNMAYKCNIQRADGSIDTRDTARIKVRHQATAYLERAYSGERKVLQEKDDLKVTCTASGYPEPSVIWTFQPDEITNITTEDYWPDNFVRTDGEKTIVANQVAVSSQGTTNNGTFICKVSNNIGAPVSTSFHLEVYAMPVTTVPSTPEPTVAAELRGAGSDGAVIGGVVAVAAFVLIVAVILIARYFMSHKGTYRTNEMKSRDVDEEKVSDDRLMGVDDDDDEDLDELSRKKRTEYFM